MVVWTHPEGSGVEALALMEKALEGTAGDDELDLDAAALEQADRLIVSTVPIVDRQLGVWRELIAIFDPLMFPNPNS